MDSIKRQDELMLITALFRDFHKSYGTVFDTRALTLTLRKLENRVRAEGLSFLTKTLPRLGKAFDKALSEAQPLNAINLGFKPQKDSKLPLFCGEFFNKVLHPDGTVLQDPCASCVAVIRQIAYLFYKYELPYTNEQEQQVITAFETAEDDLLARSESLRSLRDDTFCSYSTRRNRSAVSSQSQVVREARILLSNVFSDLDIKDIIPAHGPGAVATKQQLWEKYDWSNVSSRITQHYPLDAFFFASVGHVCDRFSNACITDLDLPARVILVPKDSRGPRLISCEPVDFQWIQQGIMRKLVHHVEHLPLTRYNVFFTDQAPNRYGALLGSSTGKYVTLDLKEASDRVSLDLVHLLFPEHICDILETVRSSSTVLPSGKVLRLKKFAPMGSALCFPVLALTIWAILTAAAPNADTRESILVYGDDVIVPKAYALKAMEQLESFGLLVNRDKSCISGFFRESCGMDAFKGVQVTPVRFRTVWSSSSSPEVYASWVAYATSAYHRKYYELYDLIVGMLFRVYGPIPTTDMHLACPSLPEVPDYMVPKRTRYNKALQKRQWYVLDLKAPKVQHVSDGYQMLLRFFSESGASVPCTTRKSTAILDTIFASGKDRFMGWFEQKQPLSVSEYTKRRASMLVRRWR
jgi:hypothetical protein